jgi:fatty acid synthase subunit alpha, fungi type
VSMIKKTLATQYKVHDAAVSMKRDLLSYKRNARKICYDVDPVELPNNQAQGYSNPSLVEKKVSTETAQVQNTTTDAVSMALPTSDVPNRAREAAAIPDIPISAAEIVVAIIAPKLRKPFGEISRAKTIKQLVGGWFLLRLYYTQPKWKYAG